MTFSTGERIAHVFRRLGMGSYPHLVDEAGSPEEAISRSLETDQPSPSLFEMETPLDRETATDIATLAGPVQSWLTSMVASGRLIEERLTWFWSDHFATAVQKVRVPYLMWLQHRTIRQHATGSFRDLLHAIAVDPAMLFYLDGARNHTGEVNENFAREVMELHTMGTGHYTQTDVTEAAKALTGWVVNVPYGRAASRFLADYEPWEAVYIPFRHHAGATTILGRTGEHTLDDVLDILLEEPATSSFVATKLWLELVGTEPSPTTIEDLAAGFRSDYSIMGLVASITNHPEFLADEAIRVKVKTPVERLVSIARGFGGDEVEERLGFTLHEMAYLPFNPPSPAGYPSGRVLLGPHQLIHAFDFLAAATPTGWKDTGDILTRAGLVDVSDETYRLVDLASDPAYKVALAVNSPEFALT